MQLRNTLAQAYEDVTRARQLIDSVQGFPTSEVCWQGRMATVWHSILNEAARARKLRALVGAALADPGAAGYHTKLHEIVSTSDIQNLLGDNMSLNENANVLRMEDYRHRPASPKINRYPAAASAAAEMVNLAALLEDSAAELDESASEWQRSCMLLPIERAVESLTDCLMGVDIDGRSQSVEVASLLDNVEGRLREIVDAAETFAGSDSAVERRSARVTIQRAAQTLSPTIDGVM